ncbi:hypothetical protein [Deinococcus peraridilitoris]|uniref:Uncharacterized protein n=1 Tax=Deinococcus peraridilitoris (strain DSM 19664 / LMG 22246 / CIP 109416 / KR-200) TaxID=937777 RepID=K9ZZ19_DEIPD|nr:hypothetical protein [Deinococcus peraridilitoris]AFZ66841.1 hypothetical protein Deipe_1291 [Deinococcus peraridilitoris DSM 19664]
MPKPILPFWLFPAAFWVTLTLLLIGLFVPVFVSLGVLALLVAPVLAAVVVVVRHVRRDRSLAFAALLALLGLVVVALLRGLISSAS